MDGVFFFFLLTTQLKQPKTVRFVKREQFRRRCKNKTRKFMHSFAAKLNPISIPRRNLQRIKGGRNKTHLINPSMGQDETLARLHAETQRDTVT